MEAFQGILLVARTPRLWPMCFLPLLGGLLAYVALGLIGGLLLVPRLPGWFRVEQGGREWWAVQILGSLAFIVLWLFLFSFVFVLIAGMFSGLIWDRLSLAVEEIAGGHPATVSLGCGTLGCGTLAADSGARLLMNGSLGLAALVLSLFLGPIPGVLTASLVGLLDYTSPAYLRRGLTLGPQMSRVLRRLDRPTLTFALVAGLLSLVPLVGVLLMPGLVAGGTLLVRQQEESVG